MKTQKLKNPYPKDTQPLDSQYLTTKLDTQIKPVKDQFPKINTMFGNIQTILEKLTELTNKKLDI